MSNDDAMNETIRVEKVPQGFIVAVFFHGATEHLQEVFPNEASAQAAGQARLTRFRAALQQQHRP